MMTPIDELVRIVLGEPNKPFDYQEYLKSETWQLKRLAKFKQVGKRCQFCNSPYRLNVHHRTYERIGKEDLNDLTVLCGKCHSVFHKYCKLYKKVKVNGRRKQVRRLS